MHALYIFFSFKSSSLRTILEKRCCLHGATSFPRIGLKSLFAESWIELFYLNIGNEFVVLIIRS